MKKVLLFTALAAALTASFAQANEKLVVAATPIPHAEILELIKPTLAKEGVDLEIKVFTDYVQPNVQVAEKRLDAAGIPFVINTALAAALTASLAQANEKLVVAATPIPHAEILELVKPTLAKEGVDLEIKVFTDYVQPNVQVAEKRLDANYFQTLPYLENFNKGKGTNLVTVVGVHVEPFGAYSKKRMCQN